MTHVKRERSRQLAPPHAIKIGRQKRNGACGFCWDFSTYVSSALIFLTKISLFQPYIYSKVVSWYYLADSSCMSDAKDLSDNFRGQITLVVKCPFNLQTVVLFVNSR